MNEIKLLTSPPTPLLLPAVCATSPTHPSHRGMENLPAHLQRGLNTAIDSLINAAIEYLASTSDAHALHSASRVFARNIESLAPPTCSYRYTPPQVEHFRSRADMDRELFDMLRRFSSPAPEKVISIRVRHD